VIEVFKMGFIWRFLMVVLDEHVWTKRKIYKVKHRERIRETDKQYYEAHKDEILARRRQRRKALRKKRQEREAGLLLGTDKDKEVKDEEKS